MKFGKFAKVLFATLILIVVWALYRQFFAVIDDFNYRLTANFEENGRTVTGSGVVRVTSRLKIVCIVGVSCVKYWRRGEAFPVRFSDNNTIFVMLAVADSTSGTAGAWPTVTFNEMTRHGRKISELPHTPFIVPEKYMPTIVHFDDLSDPTSVQVVDPQNVSATVGQGIRLKSMTIEITDDPVTWGLEETLPWVLTTKRADPKRPQYKRNFPMLWYEFPQYMHINQL
jgi:hypothetical protein